MRNANVSLLNVAGQVSRIWHGGTASNCGHHHSLRFIWCCAGNEYSFINKKNSDQSVPFIGADWELLKFNLKYFPCKGFGIRRWFQCFGRGSSHRIGSFIFTTGLSAWSERSVALQPRLCRYWRRKIEFSRFQEILGRPTGRRRWRSLSGRSNFDV